MKLLAFKSDDGSECVGNPASCHVANKFSVERYKVFIANDKNFYNAEQFETMLPKLTSLTSLSML